MLLTVYLVRDTKNGWFHLITMVTHLICYWGKEKVMNFQNWFETHYSKSQIFVQKFSFEKPQYFHEFFTKIFLKIFLVKSKLSTAKKSKTTTFSRIFPRQFFSGNQSWIFGQKMKISNSVARDLYSLRHQITFIF